MEIQSLISVVISLGWRLCSASWACSAWIARHQWRNSHWAKTDIITEVHSLDLTARVCHEALQLFGSAVDKLCPALINIVECDAESKTRVIIDLGYPQAPQLEGLRCLEQVDGLTGSMKNIEKLFSI